MKTKSALLIFLLVFSTNSIAWMTDVAVTLPGTNSELTDSDKYFNYLMSRELVNNQNGKLNVPTQDTNN